MAAAPTGTLRVIITSAQSAGRAIDSRKNVSNKHPLRILAHHFGGDVNLKAAKLYKAVVPGQRPVTETARVVADDVQRAEYVDKATDHTLAGGDEGTRPEVNSSQRRCWPHGGRQLSRGEQDRCHRDG